METIHTIKIAPDADEIFVEGKEAHTEFNGMRINFVFGKKYEESSLKEAIATAIAFSSKTWQIEFFLEKCCPCKVSETLIE